MGSKKSEIEVGSDRLRLSDSSLAYADLAGVTLRSHTRPILWLGFAVVMALGSRVPQIPPDLRLPLDPGLNATIAVAVVTCVVIAAIADHDG